MLIDIANATELSFECGLISPIEYSGFVRYGNTEYRTKVFEVTYNLYKHKCDSIACLKSCNTVMFNIIAELVG